MLKSTRLIWIVLNVLLAAGILTLIASITAPPHEIATAERAPLQVNANGDYVLLS